MELSSTRRFEVRRMGSKSRVGREGGGRERFRLEPLSIAPTERQDSGHLSDDVHKLRIRRYHDLCIRG